LIGTSFTDVLTLFDQDPDTHAVVLMGRLAAPMKRMQPHISDLEQASPLWDSSPVVTLLQASAWDMLEP
jgi:succinyl-CoA synthetase alpha subunit